MKWKVSSNTWNEYVYNARAFERYQVPYGADQRKRMTRWALHVPNVLHAQRWPGQDQLRARLLDMYHRDSGAEGLLTEDHL